MELETDFLTDSYLPLKTKLKTNYKIDIISQITSHETLFNRVFITVYNLMYFGTNHL